MSSACRIARVARQARPGRPATGQPRMPSPGMPSRSGLAGCEMEVPRLLAAGRGNRDIASELSISPGTASVRVPGILAGPGVSTRTGAAATVRRMHVLDGQ